MALSDREGRVSGNRREGRSEALKTNGSVPTTVVPPIDLDPRSSREQVAE